MVPKQRRAATEISSREFPATNVIELQSGAGPGLQPVVGHITTAVRLAPYPLPKAAGAVVMPRKRDGAPVRGADEIVEEITDNLRPWKGRMSQEAIAIAVGEKLKLLREMIPLQAKLFDRRRMRAHAQKLDKLLSEVEEIRIKDPGGLNLSLFRPSSFSEDEMGSKEKLSLAFQKRAEPFYLELRR
jgi:hypothetical protein